jgi:hypothetical protein
MFKSIYMNFFQLKHLLKNSPNKKSKTIIKIWFYFNPKKYKQLNTLLSKGMTYKYAIETILKNK